VLRSFLQPADKLFPMVATQDVGRLAAALLREDWIGTRVVELEGPTRISPNDLARAFATVLERPVRDGAARELGADIPFSGHAKSVASDPDA
jgi:NAD(P)H dehydrogenase (quinone)